MSLFGLREWCNHSLITIDHRAYLPICDPFLSPRKLTRFCSGHLLLILSHTAAAECQVVQRSVQELLQIWSSAQQLTHVGPVSAATWRERLEVEQLLQPSATPQRHTTKPFVAGSMNPQDPIHDFHSGAFASPSWLGLLMRRYRLAQAVCR